MWRPTAVAPTHEIIRSTLMNSRTSGSFSFARIFTYLAMAVAIEVSPERFMHSEMDQWAYAGAVLVISGSILCSLGKKSA